MPNQIRISPNDLPQKDEPYEAQSISDDLDDRDGISGDDDKSTGYQPPSVTISGRVIPGHTIDREQETPASSPILFWKTNEFRMLTDSWWKLVLWGVVLLLVLFFGCFCTRICYVWWDCCTDPFWGCCPRCRGCERLLLFGSGKYGAQRLEPAFYEDEDSDPCAGESMPQLYETQYFNWLHLLGLKTGGRCGEYSIAVQRQQNCFEV